MISQAKPFDISTFFFFVCLKHNLALGFALCRGFMFSGTHGQGVKTTWSTLPRTITLV